MPFSFWDRWGLVLDCFGFEGVGAGGWGGLTGSGLIGILPRASRASCRFSSWKTAPAASWGVWEGLLRAVRAQVRAMVMGRRMCIVEVFLFFFYEDWRLEMGGEGYIKLGGGEEEGMISKGMNP